MSDPLQRFIEAQVDIYQQALSELTEGYKSSHWMWFIFPQIQGLGHSDTSRFFALKDEKEVRAYIDHPLLGSRLLECTAVVLSHSTLSAEEIFGSIDAQKLHSCMTLMDAVGDHPIFEQVLTAFFAGQMDMGTLGQLDLLRLSN